MSGTAWRIRLEPHHKQQGVDVDDWRHEEGTIVAMDMIIYAILGPDHVSVAVTIPISMSG